MAGADWLRITEVILGILYSPLLYLRIIRTETRVNVIHLFGTFLFVAGLVSGSWQAYHKPFHYAQLVFLAALILMLVSGTYAEWLHYRGRSNGCIYRGETPCKECGDSTCKYPRKKFV